MAPTAHHGHGRHGGTADVPPSDQAPFPQNSERALKIVVIVLGIILVVGFLVVVVTIAWRASTMGRDTAEPAVAERPQGFSQLDVEVERDTLISQIELDGERMAVHVTRGTMDEILIIDIRRGELIGRVRLTGPANRR